MDDTSFTGEPKLRSSPAEATIHPLVGVNPAQLILVHAPQGRERELFDLQFEVKTGVYQRGRKQKIVLCSFSDGSLRINLRKCGG